MATTSACSTDETPLCEPVLQVQPDKVQPATHTPFRYPLEEPGYFFSIENAVKKRCDGQDVQVMWLYDYDPDLAVDIRTFQICGGETRCFVSVCNRPVPAAKEHRVMAIVSSEKWTQEAKDPYDFPSGALYDSVQWTLKVEGACP